MGIESVVTCDMCGEDVTGQDYATIEAKFEIDHNRDAKPDERDRLFLVLCQEHGRERWAGIKEPA